MTEQSSERIPCHLCGQEITLQDKYCHSCGKVLISCEHTMMRNGKFLLFCPKCGTRLPSKQDLQTKPYQKPGYPDYQDDPFN